MKLWLSLLLLPTLAPSSLLAQGGQPPQRIVLQALDTDGDGQLSAAEIEAAVVALAKMDRNHDGQITGDEYNPKMQDGAAANDLLTRMMAMDKNGDGVLTADEVPERMRAMFDRGDTNHDGKLTAEEIKTMSARQADPQGRPVGRGNASGMLRMDPVMDALDVDHDGILSAAEIASASGALKTLDKDADGTLSVAELRMRQQTSAQRAEHLFDEWDTNKDGGLIKTELPDRMQPLFEAIDVNHDEKIDMQEATTYFASMPAGGRGGAPGGGNAPREGGTQRESSPQNDAAPSTTVPPAPSQQ